MKRKASRFVVFCLVFLILTSPSLTVAQTARFPNDYELTLNILAPPVRDIVKSSQGIVTVSFSTFASNAPYERLEASGVLVIDNSHVLTVGHVAKYPAIATSKFTQVMFNGLQAKFIETLPDADLAILELDHPAINMKPAEVADSVEFGRVYTGVTLYSDFNLVLKRELIGAGKGAFYFFDKSIQPGVSGTPLYNNDGKIVSILSATTPAFSLGSRIEVIQELLKKVRSRIEADKKKD